MPGVLIFNVVHTKKSNCLFYSNKADPPPPFLPQISILPISSALSLWFLQRVSGYKNFIFTFGEDCFLSLLQTEGTRDKTLVSSWSAIYLKGKHLTLAHVRLFLKAGDGSSVVR